MKDIISRLETKFKDIDTKIEQLLAKNQYKALLTKIDFIKALDISIEEYDLLQDYNNIKELSEEEIKRLISLNERLEQKYKYIDLINEKIIMTCSDWRIVNKNAITYILNKDKNKQEKQNVIINVYLDETGTPLTMEQIIDKGKPNE